MSTGPLPRQADIRKLASLDAVLEGSVKVAKLDRVVQALATDSGSVNYRLQFGVSDEGINCITGRLDSVVELTCQRCLEPMEYAVASEFVLGAVSSDEKARHLPKRLEPLLVEDDLVDTQAVIEEELLLCLPIVCYHPAEQCAQQVGYQTPAVAATEAVEEPRKNPFDALAALKKPEP
jgi:uncharacterized protein